jgi:glycosyltransferase involved in cell wall biosynthesis
MSVKPDRKVPRRRIIVNVLNIVDTELAGAAMFTKNILSIWLKDESSSEVTILCSSTINASEVLDLPAKPNIHIKPVNSKNFLTRILYEQIILPFVIRSFDVYFSPTQIIPFLGKTVSPRTKLVITIHDMIPFFVKNKYNFLRTQYVKFISKWTGVFADDVIVVSQNTLNDVLSLTKISVSKLHIVYNFLTTESQPNNFNDKCFFLCISTIEPGKNLEKTLMGYKRFLEKYKFDKYRFYWIGKIGWGYSAGELNEKIVTLGLENHFYVLGYVDEMKKQDMLRNCTATVYLSHYEGFGIPVLEGLFQNKPALVSRSSSLPEVVGEAGILCDQQDIERIADAMYELITNLETYRLKIPLQVEKFDKFVQVKKFLEIIYSPRRIHKKTKTKQESIDKQNLNVWC